MHLSKKTIALFMVFSVAIGCNKNTSNPTKTTESTATNTTSTTESAATNTTSPKEEAPTKNTANTPTSEELESEETTGGKEVERITLKKGASDTDLNIILEARETKSYVARVEKGFMTCIMPNTELGEKVTIKVGGKVRDIAENGPCGEHASQSGDQVIEFINNGNKEIPFVANVSFNEHM